jgi:hypothetical protein
MEYLIFALYILSRIQMAFCTEECTKDNIGENLAKYSNFRDTVKKTNGSIALEYIHRNLTVEQISPGLANIDFQEKVLVKVSYDERGFTELFVLRPYVLVMPKSNKKDGNVHCKEGEESGSYFAGPGCAFLDITTSADGHYYKYMKSIKERPEKFLCVLHNPNQMEGTQEEKIEPEKRCFVDERERKCEVIQLNARNLTGGFFNLETLCVCKYGTKAGGIDNLYKMTCEDGKIVGEPQCAETEPGFLEMYYKMPLAVHSVGLSAFLFTMFVILLPCSFLASCVRGRGAALYFY